MHTRRRRYAISTVLFLLLVSFALPQDGGAQTIPDFSDTGPAAGSGAVQPSFAEQIQERALLAMTTPDYLVTPGDTYILRFTRSFTPTTISAIVEHDFALNLDFVGTVDTRGLTFVELQDQVEALVTESYPGSTPQIAIRSIGRFGVRVSGEVDIAGRVTVDGLTRLATVADRQALSSASLRSIAVVSADGRRRTYDLFAAQRFGEEEQNPYVRPGDEIVFRRESRRVSVSGEVHRSGAYQLRPGESLGDLLNRYADGATDAADSSRVEIRRLPPQNEVTPLLIEVDATTSTGRRTALQHQDAVRVPNRTERQPVVYFEGALADPSVPTTGSTDDPATQRVARVIRHPLRAGETLGQAARALRSSILPGADVRNAELKREGEPDARPIDLDRVLHGETRDGDLKLRPGDRVLIPFGEFEVYVTGEVERSQWVPLSNLRRLELVRQYFTAYSSERDLRVVSRDGTEKTYDLFRADRDGAREENPFLRPGDRVVVSRYDRQVTVRGQVRKPGTYQLRSGEDLGDVIATYAGGLTVNADATDVTVTRFDVGDEEVSVVEFVNAVTNPDFELLNQDEVTVPNRNDYLPVVFFEGAVGGGEEELAEESVSDQLRYQFRPGETLSNAVRSIAGRFTPVSDLENAYLLRETVIGPIAVDLRDFLYSRSLENDILLQPLDRIVVPFRQFFVTVSGAVALPGQYPYIPDRTFEYYLGLAGGTDPNRNIGSRPRITTVDGERRRPGDDIEPEDDIFFPTNNPLAYLSPFATVVGTTVSLVSLILTLTSN